MEKNYNPFHEVFPHASKLVHEAYMQRMSLWGDLWPNWPRQEV